jgi:hypothetical protein
MNDVAAHHGFEFAAEVEEAGHEPVGSLGRQGTMCDQWQECA